MESNNLDLKESINYLIDFYTKDDIQTLKSFRFKIKSRIKKGINLMYKRELELIQEMVDRTLRLL